MLKPLFRFESKPGKLENGTHITKWNIVTINVTNSPSADAIYATKEYKELYNKFKKSWSEEKTEKLVKSDLYVTLRWLLITKAAGAC